MTNIRASSTVGRKSIVTTVAHDVRDAPCATAGHEIMPGTRWPPVTDTAHGAPEEEVDRLHDPEDGRGDPEALRLRGRSAVHATQTDLGQYEEYMTKKHFKALQRSQSSR